MQQTRCRNCRPDYHIFEVPYLDVLEKWSTTYAMRKSRRVQPMTTRVFKAIEKSELISSDFFSMASLGPSTAD